MKNSLLGFAYVQYSRSVPFEVSVEIKAAHYVLEQSHGVWHRKWARPFILTKLQKWL